MERLNIEQAGLHEAKTKLSEENKSKLRQLIGKPIQTRCELGGVGAVNGTVKDGKTANKVVRELKETDVKIKYAKLREDKWYISVFTNASVGKLPDGVSSAIGISPYQKRDCFILSSKVRRVVSSTYDAEVLALSEGLEVGYGHEKIAIGHDTD